MLYRVAGKQQVIKLSLPGMAENGQMTHRYLIADIG